MRYIRSKCASVNILRAKTTHTFQLYRTFVYQCTMISLDKGMKGNRYIWSGEKLDGKICLEGLDHCSRSQPFKIEKSR
jgi:hypothetical protein